MKTLITILLFVAIGCYTSGASDITQKVFVRTNLDGIIQHVVMTCRGKEKVMTERFSLDAKGKLVIDSRSYSVGGDLMMIELAEHTRGKLDTICIYHPGTNTMEVFTRSADGSVKPVSTRALLGYEQENAANTDFFRTMANTNTTDAQWSQKVQETKQKVHDAEKQIQDAEEQKTDGKQ
jgi:hypothetical protein